MAALSPGHVIIYTVLWRRNRKGVRSQQRCPLGSPVCSLLMWL